MFDIESSIRKWKRELRKQKSMDDGIILELENHLRDQIEDLISQGYSHNEAFTIAVEKFGSISDLNNEEKKIITPKRNIPFPDLWISFIMIYFRRIFQRKFYSLMNIAGLAFGITGFILISIYLYDEFSYEQFHPEAEKIYRLSYTHINDDGSREKQAYSSGSWPFLLKEEIPIIKDYSRFLMLSHGYLSTENQENIFYEEGIYWSDSNFFNFFGFRLKSGDPDFVLKNPNSIVLTERTSKKYFSAKDPIGQILKYKQGDRHIELKVTGIMYNPPSNTHLQPDFVATLLSLDNFYGSDRKGWISQRIQPMWTYSYLKISEKESIPLIEEHLTKIWNDGLGKEMANELEPLLMPITDIHYNPPVRWEIDDTTDVSYLNGLGVLSIFLLIIAIVNFINLTTAQVNKRSKEVGIRKTLGSSIFNLKLQFFLETLIIVFTAVLLAVLIIYLVFPQFKQITSKDLNFWPLLIDIKSLIFLFILVMTVSILAGVYPSFYLAKFNPLLVLKGIMKTGHGVEKGRKILVVFQFTLAIIMIICTLGIYRQLKLINNSGLAKNREQIISIRTRLMGTQSQVESYRNEILSDSRIINASLGMHLPRQKDFGRIDTKFYIDEFGNREFYWNKFESDGNIAKTFGMEFIAGRDFSQLYDPNSVIINEAAVKAMGITPQKALGMKIEEDSINVVYQAMSGTVIGVVKDFPYMSIKEKITPLVINAQVFRDRNLSVRVGLGNVADKLEFLEQTWKKIFPGMPFEYWFLDNEFERLYQQERRLGKLLPVFSFLAIFISLMGLFALTVFVTENRIKEIGIRKVMGSSTIQILGLLSWYFIKLIFVSFIVGIPVAYLTMNSWLNNFSYRIELNFGIFLISAAFVFFIAILTISYQAISAALTNPTTCLRYE